MKLPNKHGDRLRTKNFKRVTSEAAISIDYDDRLKIIEIEYKTGKIYHYLKMDKKTWKKFSQILEEGTGLGAYLNQDFKEMVTKKDFDFYEITQEPDYAKEKQYFLH